MVSARLLPILLRPRLITPAMLFNSAELGIWFDPSDLQTLYQDSAGTTNVSAQSQPTGLILDKASQQTIGSELFVNPNVVDLTGFTTGGSFPPTLVYSNGAQATVDTDDSAARIQTSTISGFTVGKTYRVLLKINNQCLKGNLVATSFTWGTVEKTISAGMSTTELHVIATSQSGVCRYYLGDTSDNDGNVATISAHSIRELSGNHASQPTSTSRPTLTEESAGICRSLAFLGTDDFVTTASGGGGAFGIMLCAAIKVGAVGADQTIFSDAGTNTGYRMRLTSANQIELSIGTGSSRTAVTTSGTALALNEIKVVLAWHDGTNAYVQIGNDAPAVAACGAASAGTAAITLGRDNGAATSYWTGRLFPMVYLQSSPGTAAQREAMKRYCAAAAGVSL